MTIKSCHWASNKDHNCSFVSQTLAHLLFEEVPLLQSQSVSLSDDRNDVHHLTKTSHELHIQRPKTEENYKGERDVMEWTS